MIIKKEIFSLVIWLIFDVIIDALYIGTFGLSYYMTSVGLGIISLLIFGYLLGKLYTRFEGNDKILTEGEYKN